MIHKHVILLLGVILLKNCNLKLILVTNFSAPNKLNLYSGAFTSTF